MDIVVASRNNNDMSCRKSDEDKKRSEYEISYEKAFEGGSWFVLFMLNYPRSIEKYLREKIEKLLYIPHDKRICNISWYM
jgi:hypothetical protein